MIKFRVVMAALAVLVLAASAPPASAQEQGRLAITGGLSWFTGDVNDDNTWIAGLQYSFPTMTRERSRGTFLLSADFLQVDSTRAESGGPVTDHVSLIPVLLNYRYSLGATPWYIGGGVGVFFSEENIPEMGISSDVNFAWQLFAGYNLGKNWFVEGRWLASNDPGDDSMLIAQLGFRF
ncbi:MAG TPA: acyloxyacyl hydrolase [Armatimonadetes bacterium]|jgi:hypothetical protein|nr:acyloxyacyl hydrolase [Armatimonadota bacterium]